MSNLQQNDSLSNFGPVLAKELATPLKHNLLHLFQGVQKVSHTRATPETKQISEQAGLSAKLITRHYLYQRNRASFYNIHATRRVPGIQPDIRHIPLKSKTSASFETYATEVPRLLPKLGNWSKATSGMAFSWKRAVFGEYNVIGQSILMVVLALWYKSYLLTGSKMLPMAGGIVLVLGAVFMLTIRVVKRR